MKENVANLLKAMNYEKTAQESFDKMMEVVKKAMTDGEDFSLLNQVMNLSHEEMMKRMPGEVAKIYEATFSDEEIEQLITFYTSSAGQKMNSTTQIVWEVSQRIGFEIVADATKRISENPLKWATN